MNAIQKNMIDRTATQIAESLAELEQEVKRLKKEHQQLMERLSRLREENHTTIRD